MLGNKKLTSPQLEGTQSIIGLKAVKQDLSTFVETFRQQFSSTEIAKLSKIIKQLDYAIAISKKILMAQSLYTMDNPGLKYLPDENPARKEFLKRLADIAYDISKDIASLPAGESMIFPGGYRNERGGHAVLYEITKAKDNSGAADNQTPYTFTVVNTGDGVAEFENAFSLIKTLLKGSINGQVKFADYQIQNLKLKNVSNPEFLLEIVRVAADPKKEHGTKAMFEPIIKHLAESNVENIRKGREHGIQTNGTCSHSCVETWLDSSLHNLAFKAFKFFSMQIGLTDLIEVQKEASNRALIDSLEAEWKGDLTSEKLKGHDVLTTIIGLGKKNAAEAAKELEGLLKNSIANLEKDCSKLTTSLKRADKRLKHFEKRETPEEFADYVNRLVQKTENLKIKYCEAAGQDPAKKTSSPSIFAKTELKEKWDKYEAKMNKHAKLLEEVRRNPLFYANSRDKIVEIKREIEQYKSELMFSNQELSNNRLYESVLHM